MISTIEQFIGEVRKDSAEWPHVWFRGEPGDVETPLLPKLYRPLNGRQHDENWLLQLFRMKAPVFAASSCPCPDRQATDQWLFLARHAGLPTRLLDWTESALIGLYFAVQEEGQELKQKASPPVVWLLDPIALNRLSESPSRASTHTAFPLTWYTPPQWPKEINIGSENIRGAWSLGVHGVSLPVAVQPTNVHPRMSVQRSCFTVHGKDKRSVAEQVPQLLKRYEIDPDRREVLRKDLRLLGISHSTVWPDLDGLAKELGELY